MHLSRSRPTLAPFLFLLTLAVTGCSHIPVGRRAPSDLTLAEENYKLQTQKEKLLQELTLVKKESETLRVLLERQSASRAANASPASGPGASDRSAEVVTQLAELRTKVASLEVERDTLKQQLAMVAGSSVEPSPADAAGSTDTQTKLATALRSYTLLQEEYDQLKAENEKITAEKSAIEAQLAVTQSAVPLAAQVEGLRDQLRQTQAQAAAMAAENADLKTRLVLSAPAPGSPPFRTGNVEPASAPTEPRDLSTTPPARVHTVVAGDSLTKISRQYYGTPHRWTEILAANRDILQDERSLVIGRTLRIP